MKRVLAVSLMTLVGAVSATELGLQPGQWSFSVKSVNVQATSYASTSKNSDSDFSSTNSNGTINASGTGNYALNDKITLGLYARVFSSTNGSESDISNLFTSSKRKDFDFGIEPSIEYKVSNNLWLYGAAYLFIDDADVEIDQDGNEDYSGRDQYINTVLWSGIKYKKDIKSNVMMESELLAGLSTRRWKDEVDSTDTYQENFLLTRGNVEAHYFLANNFSVNAGVGFSLDNRLSAKDDGAEVDFGNNTYSAFGYGTRFGFTFYYR